MLGDLASSADPHTVASHNVIEKLDETGDPAGAAGQPVVQSPATSAWDGRHPPYT
jgi:hypothetical protein